MRRRPEKREHFESAEIIYLNFSGRKTQFNEKGYRCFNIVLDPKTAERMKEDGWNVRYTEGREEGDEGFYHINVTASYMKRPPTVVLITSKGRTNLDEETIDLLDYAEIVNVDVTINPSYWTNSGRSGWKAYLQAIYVTIQEDRFAQKYDSVPELGSLERRRALPSGSDAEFNDPSDPNVIDGEVMTESVEYITDDHPKMIEA